MLSESISIHFEVPLWSKWINPAGIRDLFASELHPPELYIVVPITGIVLIIPLLLIVDVWYTLVLSGRPHAVAESTVDTALPSNGTHDGDE